MSLSPSETTMALLQKNWAWTPTWEDHPTPPGSKESGRLVTFRMTIDVLDAVGPTIIHLSADTRYKLYLNAHLVSIGPTRGSDKLWYYDTIPDSLLSPHLNPIGTPNSLVIIVWRAFPGVDAAAPFGRTRLPGLTVLGQLAGVDVGTAAGGNGWESRVENGVKFPTGIKDDIFLHIFERLTDPSTSLRPAPFVPILPYTFGTKTGESSLWNLSPRLIPQPYRTRTKLVKIRHVESALNEDEWQRWLDGQVQVQDGKGEAEWMIRLPPGKHVIELEAPYHLNAWIEWVYTIITSTTTSSSAASSSTYTSGNARPTMKITYSECYEQGTDGYPSDRVKRNRRDRAGGANKLCGPHDFIELDTLPLDENRHGGVRAPVRTYEPFWYRTFRFLRVEFDLPEGTSLDLLSLRVDETGYPLEMRASWEAGAGAEDEEAEAEADRESRRIWDISVRTLQNCVFDGYSDCPFFEQLQYAQDTRSSSIFHYLISGDDRLARQALLAFQASQTPEGMLLSRYPAHQDQLISGFPLFWCIMAGEHQLYFADDAFARRLVPSIDRVLDFFERHRDPQTGLVGRMPYNHWRFIDWVKAWAKPGVERGTPGAGARTGVFTYFSILYAYALQQAAGLLRRMRYRLAIADEYGERAASLLPAIREHCFDGEYFTDSLASEGGPYSQHPQVWAVLSGVVTDRVEQRRLLAGAFAADSGFAPCSIVAMHYAFRALAKADLYSEYFHRSWAPWRQMIEWEMSTWEEDPVSQRSDCHAWGSLALYEYTSEVAGLKPTAAGWASVSWEPKPELFPRGVKCEIAMGGERVASVVWAKGKAVLTLPEAVPIRSRLSAGPWVDHEPMTTLELSYDP